MTEIELTRDAFEDFLAGLLEREDRLEPVLPGEEPVEEEVVDEYVFSAHVEALRSDGIEGDVWGTLEDLELTARSEDEAWEKIKDFYASRGCVLLRVEGDEYVVAEELAVRLRLVEGT